MTAAASMWSFISIYMIFEEEGTVPRISCKVTGPSPERQANNNGVSLTLNDAGAEVTVADRLTATGGANIHIHIQLILCLENPGSDSSAMPGCCVCLAGDGPVVCFSTISQGKGKNP